MVKSFSDFTSSFIIMYNLPPFRIRVVPKTLIFKKPAGTSRGIYKERQVWYIVLSSATKSVRFTGLGECAPLYDLSCDYSADYESRLKSVCREVEKNQRIDCERLRNVPSMLFGLQSAFLSAIGSLKGDYRLLFPSSFTQGEYGIPINGLIWMGNFEEMSTRLDEKLKEGFRCIKIKIGAIDFESEIKLISQLRRRYSSTDVQLRLDANGGFSPLDAPRKLERLSHYAIHSIEQPIRQGQWQEMAKLCANTPIPIALDEELIGINETQKKIDLLHTIHPQYIILKPSLHGAFTGCDEWIDLAKKQSIGYWVTSALESNVGLNAIAQWCASKKSSIQLPQGLGTGQLFVKNFTAAPLSLEKDFLWYGDVRQRNFFNEIKTFKNNWYNSAPYLTVHTSGSTGKPRAMKAEKKRMIASAQATISSLRLKKGDTALLAMPLQFIAGQMVIVRSIVGEMRLIPVTPTSHPFSSLHEPPYFAALTPMQVYESLKIPHERSLLRRTHCLIIGGGKISPELEEQLKTFPNEVWSTYGMTETLSHIALRRLNGNTSNYYFSLRNVTVSLSDKGTLVINAPQISPNVIETNDIAQLSPNGGFQIIGRRDNVICSGGIKLHIEEIEEKLSFLSIPFQITAIPNASLGETVTMLYVAESDKHSQLEMLCRKTLKPYEVPHHYFRVASLPKTETGKPARAKAKEIARTINQQE